MATDQRISALPSVTSPSSTDVLPIVSAGITSQVTVGNLHSTLATTGSNTFHGNQTIDGNLSITGTTTLGGNIIPSTPRGATLGTLTYPFADIFVSSGSINIAGVPGQPNTTLSNVSGNILISAGGIQLVGTGSFNAVSASFSYLSGTFTHIGSQFNIGDTVTTGSLQVSGSTITIGNNTLQGNTKLSGSVTITGSMYLTGSDGVGYINSHRILTDLDSGSFAITGSNVFVSGQTITGSVNVTGSITVTGSLFMGGTAQTYISAVSITNPSNYVIHQFLTSSYHGATYAFSVVEDSTKKTTVYSNYVVAQGNNKISSNIGGDSQVTSEGSSPNPSFTIAISGSYAQFKVTDTGTFTYRGIVQLY
jgi:hypothetical protein